MRLGWGVGANDAELVLRSLPSLALRYEAQDRGRRARWRPGGASGPRSRAVLHPALPGVARARALGGALQRTPPACSRSSSTPRFAGRAGRCLRRRAAAVQHRLFVGRAGEPGRALRPAADAQRGGAPAPGTLVRFSIGLEAVDDLIADLDRALGALR